MARALLAACLTAFALFVYGCGGGGSAHHGAAGRGHPTIPRIGPQPRETAFQAAKRIAAEATADECRHPGEALWGFVQGTKETQVCKKVFEGVDWQRFHVVPYGSGAVASVPGFPRVFALTLDRDRSYKVVFGGEGSPEERTRVSPDDIADLAVSALRRDNCDELAPYAFVYETKRKWCARPLIRQVVKDLTNEWDAAPRRLGGEAGILFYGLSVKPHHYFTMALVDMNHYFRYYDSYKVK